MIVGSIEFTIINPETVKKMSSAKITKTELYDEEGYPIEGGVMDPRMGVVDPGIRCRTCGGTIGDCNGHFGFVELTKPIVHVLYAKIVFSILKVICKKCGRILVDEKDIDKLRERRVSLKDLIKLVKKKCPHCKAEQGNLKFIKPYSFAEGAEILAASLVRERLEKITDSDFTLMGFRNFRPEWMILTLLPVPPVSVRPSITLETGERSEDDLTHKLVDIVRINERLRENIELGAPDFILADLWELLQYHVSTYFDNELTGVPPARHRSRRVLKTLSQRLKTKEGRFRGNLAGKRVNFSARSVVSPDPFIRIDDVGVPRVIASELTLPVRATEENVDSLRKFVENGPEVWPGANYVIRPDGRRKKVTTENCKEIAKELTANYIIERHLLDGDIVLFNRQPSLHRMSIMAHKVKVMDHKTFRLNPIVTVPYNADFDGDEMNLHVPQMEEAMVEAENLMAVEKNIRSPRFSGPIIGLRQDYVTGLFLLTRYDTVLERREFVQLLKNVDDTIEIPEKEKMTGRELFSMLLPKDFSVEFRAKSGERVLIENGQLKEGYIDKAGVGAESGKLLSKLENQYGVSKVNDFLNKISKLSLNFLMKNGFSISISDQVLDESGQKKVGEILADVKRETDELLKQYKAGELKILVGRTEKESVETLIKRRANKALNEVSEIIVKHMKDNPTLQMAVAGARGDVVNIVQTAAMVGQEMIMGERIEKGYYQRVFPHFKRGDIGLETGGFVGRGFVNGLTPFEFFFDAINSRESLMDKSLKTRHSGYMERRLVGALQDLKVEYDGTVRDSSNNIVEFFPGGDGLDPSKVERGGIDVERIARKLFD